MFDDPKKELQRLQQELLAEEENTEPDFPVEDDWLDRELAEAKALSGYQEPAQPPVRNYANGYGTGQPAYKAPGEEADPELDTYSDEEPVVEQEKSVKGFVILACLEALGIVGIIVYWLLVLL
jgi:hypothetical protein